MLMMLAGFALAGTPATDMPAAHIIHAMVSESYPPHLPSTRTGRIFPCHVIPATPCALLVNAPRIPAVRVPCQELISTLQSLNFELLVSVELIQSPGSEESASRPLPSLAKSTSLTKSYPGNSRPLLAMASRSG